MRTPQARMEWHRERLHASVARGEPEPADNTGGAAGDRALWCAVLVRAFNDALGDGGYMVDAHLRKLAHHWMTRANNPDRRMVCDFAGVDEDYVMRQYAAKVGA